MTIRVVSSHNLFCFSKENGVLTAPRSPEGGAVSTPFSFEKTKRIMNTDEDATSNEDTMRMVTQPCLGNALKTI